MMIQIMKMKGSINDETFCKIQQGNMMISMRFNLLIPVRKIWPKIPVIDLNLQTQAEPVTGSSTPVFYK